MFGESESESPRTGSPWDGFLVKSDPASPAVEPVRSPRIVPKLVPEVEEGNIEYKLRLLNPSMERFTRLVTQLKWRLLEGGGQAYYELGVADSGQLVGLSRTHLEQSLQTLEEMAGEIGASVIVVKEIEVPPAVVEAVKTSGSRGKIADGAMRMNKVRVSDYAETPPLSVGAEEESELSALEGDDESLFGTSPARLSPGVFVSDRISVPSSRRVSSNDQSYDSAAGDDYVDIEISSVYKPRPHRRRTPTPTATPPRVKRAPSDDVFCLDLTVLHAPSLPMDVPNGKSNHSPRSMEDKWKNKDLRRTLHTQIPRLIVQDDGQSDVDNEFPCAAGVDTIGTSDHLKALDDLEMAAALFSFNGNNDHRRRSQKEEPSRCPSLSPSSRPSSNSSSASSETVTSLFAKDLKDDESDIQGDDDENDDKENDNETEIENKSTCSDIMHNGILTPDDPTERRYIVEALVLVNLHTLEYKYKSYLWFSHAEGKLEITESRDYGWQLVYSQLKT
ncbi:uncharacterized protein FOMMEDRAFT_144140 [Fomitiporia mediterranea MF3/22]|uniref:uncharacterized protein n=1 Tax=Fomitiporia mediterranea (strain MF3/22) TaxID=694068 RepID=UPI0004407EE8|nr:uncharacterized protein FOMMEDRAFT_144140 [Fomitiporia mediterranea MF3/22]EJD08001.1 hypothetical protein FOMMEDRAFT_144140 [Fomitiporia mediterranea MF3/22]